MRNSDTKTFLKCFRLCARAGLLLLLLVTAMAGGEWVSAYGLGSTGGTGPLPPTTSTPETTTATTGPTPTLPPEHTVTTDPPTQTPGIVTTTGPATPTPEVTTPPVPDTTATPELSLPPAGTTEPVTATTPSEVDTTAAPGDGETIVDPQEKAPRSIPGIPSVGERSNSDPFPVLLLVALLTFTVLLMASLTLLVRSTRQRKNG